MNGVIAVIIQGVVTVLVDGDVDASVKHADGVAHRPKPRVLFIRVVVITHSRSSVGSGGKSLVVVLIQFHRCSGTQRMTMVSILSLLFLMNSFAVLYLLER